MWSAARIEMLCVIATCVNVELGVIANSDKRAPMTIEDSLLSAKLMEEISSENIKENLRFPIGHCGQNWKKNGEKRPSKIKFIVVPVPQRVLSGADDQSLLINFHINMILSKRPHIAGKERDEVVLVDFIKQKWTVAGLDAISVFPYDVLLSYPKQNDSSYVAILNEDGTETDVSQKQRLLLDREQNDPDVVHPFNAYSASGEPEGDLVYVNFGTIEDFIYLNRTLNINPAGKICIVRYGTIFRGDKAEHAEQYGCIGLILYSDPKECTVPSSSVYPDNWFLPPTGAQRGTLFLDRGDPRTPDYPAIESAWHMPESQLQKTLPKIPVTPIGYIDAVKYLGKLAGDEVLESWKGGLNITYRYGPGFRDTYQNKKLKMSVKTENEAATIHNVIGYIRGSIEPDRYVLLGNHRDAWVYGAIDPSSGTAVMLEVARAFGEMVKQGWRPRRTLMFCSWGAEEYGLIGSTEWVEQFQKELHSRAIAYLNVDYAVIGNFSLIGHGVPSLTNVLFKATKLVRNPDVGEITEGRETVYDTWKKRMPSVYANTPRYSPLGSGRDFTTFLQKVGVPWMDIHYTYDLNTKSTSYPLYHTVYDTFELVTEYIDYDFTFHRAVGQTWIEIGRRLADSTFLPIDARFYGTYLKTHGIYFAAKFGNALANHSIDISVLHDAIKVFTTAASNIHRRIDGTDANNVLEVRALNDQLMQLERAFIDQNPLPGRKYYRHVIMAPSLHNTYGSTSFPRLTDSMFDIDADPDQEGRWEEVKRQYSIVVFHILSAAATLDPFVPTA